MKINKHLFLILVAVVIGIFVTGNFNYFGVNTALADSQKVKSRGIIEKYGKGFLEVKPNGLKILHVTGTAYERGYQHGWILKEEIEETLNPSVAMWAVWIGGGDYNAGLARMLELRDKAVPFIPAEFKREMKGIADALADKGSNLTYDDIVLWNTTIDIACTGFSADSNSPGIRNPYPEPAHFCSTVGAYGEATPNGQLVVGKNFDWPAVPENRKNSLIMIGAPTDGGHGFFVPIFPGTLATVESMNEVGIVYGGSRSSTAPETMKGLHTAFLSRTIAQYADSVDDVINLLTVYPQTVGQNVTIVDGKPCPAKNDKGLYDEVCPPKAAVIEIAPNEIAVRYPETGKDVIWATNHYNAYPGWQGYTGYNMVTNQALLWGIDASTVGTWQEGLRQYNDYGTYYRYNRIGQLLNENYGNVTMDKMIQIMSDRYDIEAGRTVPWNEPNFNTIADGPAVFEVAASAPYYKGGKVGPITATDGNHWSFISTPGTGDVAIAVAGQVPAQQGSFMEFNLKKELKRQRSK